MTMAEHWGWIYLTFPDNAFDYVGKPFYVEEGLIEMWDGTRMVKYAEVPF